MKCMAYTKKGARCNNGVKSGATVVSGGMMYRACGPHFDLFNNAGKVVFQIDRGESLPKGEMPEQLRLDTINSMGSLPGVRRGIDVLKEHEAKLEQSRLGTAWINKEIPVEDDTRTERVMVTGHLDVNENAVHDALITLFRRFRERFGIENCLGIFGGAKGADYTAARAAKNVSLPFDLWIPHAEYFNTYHPMSTDNWEAMLAQARTVNYSVPSTVPWHYSHNFKRNIDMVQRSNHYIVVSNVEPARLLEATRGGTAHCTKQIKAHGVRNVHWVNSVTGEVNWVNL